MEWIYETNEDNSARFALGQVFNENGKTLFCFGINPSTACPSCLDNTICKVIKISKYNGYDNWIMLNIYPQRATNPNYMHLQCDENIIASNMLIIKNGRVMNPSTHFDEVTDVIISEGKILKIKKASEEELSQAEKVIDATNLVVAPGLVDIHVHFRDPGFTHKETLETGALAAAAGGYTSVICMANTSPAIDNVETFRSVQDRADMLKINVYQAANVTMGMKGNTLVDMDGLHNAGALGFTDDGLPIMDDDLMNEALKKAKELDVPISLHEEDPAYIGSPGNTFWIDNVGLVY